MQRVRACERWGHRFGHAQRYWRVVTYRQIGACNCPSFNMVSANSASAMEPLASSSNKLNACNHVAIGAQRAVQPSLPCNHHCRATITPCNHHAVQPSLSCNHHCRATITAMQPSLPCNHHCHARTALIDAGCPQWLCRVASSWGITMGTTMHRWPPLYSCRFGTEGFSVPWWRSLLDVMFQVS